MRIYQTLRKRGLALFLALIMCLSLVQVPAFAAEDDASEPADAPVMDVTGPGVQEPEAVPEEESPAPESEEIAAPDTQEEPEADEPEEYAPEYASVEELEAAFEAAVEALEDGGVEGGIAALEEYLNIFDRLSPEDQEANQEAREAAVDYLQTLLDSLEGIEDEDVEALANHTATFYFYVNNGRVAGPVRVSINPYNQPTIKSIVDTYFSSYYTGTITDYQYRDTNGFGGWHSGGSSGSVKVGTAAYIDINVSTSSSSGGGGTTAPDKLTFTVDHKYYTNGKYEGTYRETLEMSPLGYNGSVYGENNITKRPEYDNKSYVFSSISPESIRVNKGETGNKGTFTLTYNRTESVNVSYTVKHTYRLNGNVEFTNQTTGTGTVGNTIYGTDVQQTSYEGKNYTYSSTDSTHKITLSSSGSNELTLYYDRTEKVEPDRTFKLEKTVVGLNASLLDGITINYTTVCANTTAGTLTASGTLRYSDGTVDESDNTITWNVPYFYGQKLNDSSGNNATNVVTITENCDVTGYTYEASAGSNLVDVNSDGTIAVKVSSMASGATRKFTNTYTKNPQPETKEIGLVVYKVFKGDELTEDAVFANSETKEPVVKYTYTISHADTPIGGPDFAQISGTMDWEYLGTQAPDGNKGVAAYKYSATVSIPKNAQNYAHLLITEPDKDTISGYRWFYNKETWQSTGYVSFSGCTPDNPKIYNFADHYEKIVPETPDLTITKSVDKSSIKVGSELIYTIKVVNNGKADATNVVVTDTLPAELTYVSKSTVGCREASAQGNKLTWKLGNIKASEEVEFTFKATADRTGNIENMAVVNCAEKVTDTSAPVPTAIYSFMVTKENDGFKSVAGTGIATVHYTVTVTNNGDISLYGLNIKDVLEPVVKVNNVEATAQQASMVLKPTSLTLNGQSVGTLGTERSLDVTSETITNNWDLVLGRNTEFKSNDVVTLEYDIEVRNLTRDTLYVNLKNTATCGTWTAQSAPAMRSAFRAADDGYVEESATSGAVAGSDAGGSIGPADPEKTVTVTWVDEKGNVLYKVEDVKPGEVPAADKYTELSGNEVPTKPEDAEYTYTFKEWEKTVDTDGNVTYKATYTATPKTPVPTPADWGKLTLTKTANKTQARAGEDITYTIRVTNNTGKNLTGIRVSEPLDTNVTFKSAAPAGYDAASGVWTIASLANGASATLTLTVTVKDGVTNATIRNTAAITDASTTGPDPEKLPDGTRPGDTANVTVPEADARRVTVTWLNWNGDRLDRADWNTDEREPSYSGRRPTRPDSSRYTYTFAGWGNREVDEDGNVTYTALFDRERIDDDDDRPTGGGTTGGNTGGGTTGGSTGGTTTIPDTQTPLDPGTTIIDQEVPLAGAVGLNDADHFAYVIGYEDGTVRPLNNISRAEVATIFFRLMTDDYRQANWSTVNSFSDVKEGDWYNNAISTCARAGALKGRGDGSVFDPNANITRAEFAVIAARFLDSSYVDDGKGDFADTADHWAAKEIRLAAKAGWVNGNGNTFNPDAYITRAEVMTIVNRMLDRTPDKDHMLPDMKKWTDNPEDAWYYEAVQEATNEHDYTRDETAVESWTLVKEHRDWAALELGWAANGGASAPQGETETQGLPDGI